MTVTQFRGKKRNQLNPFEGRRHTAQDTQKGNTNSRVLRVRIRHNSFCSSRPESSLLALCFKGKTIQTRCVVSDIMKIQNQSKS